MGIYIILSSVIGGLIFALALFFLDKFLAKKHTGEATDELKTIIPEIEQLDISLEAARAHLRVLEPISKLIEVKEKEKNINETLEIQQVIFKKLETKLKEMQVKVEDAESAHNSLKKEKEESVNLATELKDRNVKLEQDNNTLQSELSQSLGQLTLLSSEVKLTPDQEAGFKKLRASVTAANEQLKTLSGTYKRSSNRFTALFAQYSDLEKEFTKLVEKELGGDD